MTTHAKQIAKRNLPSKPERKLSSERIGEGGGYSSSRSITQLQRMFGNRAVAQAIQMKADAVIQRQQTEIYVKNVTGSYTDAAGTAHPIDYAEDMHIATTKSHPKGKVSYDGQVKKKLKKNGIVPNTIPDEQITITYEQYGRKL